MEVEFSVLDVDYVDRYIEVNDDEIKKADIRIFGRNNDGKILAIDKNYYPYLYCVPSGDITDARKKINGMETDGFKIKGIERVEKIAGKEAEKVKALKIYSYHPSDLKKIRNAIKDLESLNGTDTYEFSINFYRKYLIDKNLKPMQKVKVEGEEKKSEKFGQRIEINGIEATDGPDEEYNPDTMAFDIEVHEGSGERKIIMISFFAPGMEKVVTYRDGDYGDEVEVVENEEKLIKKFVKTVRKYDPDVIVTYNGDEYDFQLLKERSEKYGINMDIGRDGSKVSFPRRARSSSARVSGRIHVDIYRFVDNILSRQLETEVLSLSEVSKEILDETKMDMELEEMLQNWEDKENLGKVTEYSLRDSEITYKLAENLLPQINELSKVVGQLPFDCSRMTYGQLVEWYLLRRSRPERIAPKRPKWKEIQKRRKESPFKGGFVKEPTPGIYDSITVLDFQSLYPTIIVSYNISPETIECEHNEETKDIPGKDLKFCEKKEGFIPSVLRELIEKRSEVKEDIKKSEKGTENYEKLDNRQYALKVLANSVYGYYGYVGARWYSRECAESITALGRKWIKEVMDMAEDEKFKVVYGDTDSLMLKGGDTDRFLKKVNSELPGIMELELEGKFKRGIFVSKEEGKGAKKRYALVNEEDNLKIRGFETVRRDWCELAKRVQRRVLEKVLIEDSRDESINYVKNTVTKIRERNVDMKDLVIYTQLTKSVEDYKSTSPHVEAAKKMKSKGMDVGPGSVIMYVITTGDGSISERAEPYRSADIADIDTDYYISNQVVPAAIRVLKVLGVDEEQILGKGSQESLEDFTG